MSRRASPARTTAATHPVNHFSNAKKFATPEDREVVAPNTDTLYSLSHLDLKKGPVVLRHPDMGKRFFDFELVDPYTNVIDYVGTRTTGSKAGQFAISWNGREGLEEEAREGGHRQGHVIKSKYRRVWVIGRTLAGDEADQTHGPRADEAIQADEAQRRRFKLPADCPTPDEPSEYPTPTTGRSSSHSSIRHSRTTRRRSATSRCSTSSRRSGSEPGLSPDDAGPPGRRRRCPVRRRHRRGGGAADPRADQLPAGVDREQGMGHGRLRSSATSGPTTNTGPGSRSSESARTRPRRRSIPLRWPTPTAICSMAPTTTRWSTPPTTCRRRSTSGR